MYDYVILGGGSAGCVLANRLSEDGKHTVLLLEAGSTDNSPFIHMPGGVAQLLRTKSYNWYFDTEPEANMGDRPMYWPRGKVLGGSSSINGIVYIRGHQKDYDEWEALGNEGWSFSDVLPYFKKSIDQARGEDEYHGIGGPLKVSDPSLSNPLFPAYIEAGKQAGIPFNSDFNGQDQEGVGPYQQTAANGRRCSTAVAYLKPAMHRPNLTVITKAHVSKILIDRGVAVGAEYIQGKQKYSVHANKEVLLCAGAVQSPHLLKLSGIGPSKELQKFGIKTVKDLPGVGENLQDHLDVSIQHHCLQPVTFARIAKNPFYAAYSLARYFTFHTGEFASNGLETGGFIKTDPSLDRPDIQYHFITSFMVDHARDLSAMREHGMMMHSCQLRPESVGNITLRSNDPLDSPKIFANYLDSEKDQKVQIAGLKIARKIFSQEAFDLYRGDEKLPGAHIESDEDILDYIRNSAETIYHPVGSCKMGNDEMAVVDKDLKVYGIDHLRVVDASIMPKLVGGNTNAPTIMIAEKIADLIKKEPESASSGSRVISRDANSVIL